MFDGLTSLNLFPALARLGPHRGIYPGPFTPLRKATQMPCQHYDADCFKCQELSALAGRAGWGVGGRQRVPVQTTSEQARWAYNDFRFRSQRNSGTATGSRVGTLGSSDDGGGSPPVVGLSGKGD